MQENEHSKLQPSVALQVLSKNLQSLQAANPSLSSDAKLAKRAGMDQKTVWRVVNMATEPTSNQISKLAAAFGLAPWQLLVPDLNPSNEPVLALASAQMKEMLNKIASSKEAIEGYLRVQGNTRPGDL